MMEIPQYQGVIIIRIMQAKVAQGMHNFIVH
jgi:hypothetical protein